MKMQSRISSIDSKRFGKLSFGKGFSAAYGSASRDLSRTDSMSLKTLKTISLQK